MRVNQKHLGNVLQDIFKDKNVLTNVRKKGKIQTPSGSFLELDFWIPEIKLAFEFQEGHHYTGTTRTFHSLDAIQHRDSLKQQAIDSRGEKLIIVPYWWDGEAESLKSTIRLQRPDLFPLSSFPPISPDPPTGFIKTYEVPGIGEPMLPTFVFSGAHEVSSWWISEKYDGIRGLWSTTTAKFYSRFANEVYIPQLRSFSSSINLDGEFWSGRGLYENVQASLLQRNSHKEMEYIRFIAFDSPNNKTEEKEEEDGKKEIEEKKKEYGIPFEQRFGGLLSANLEFHPFIIIASYFKSNRKQHLSKLMDLIASEKGEGIVLRKPKALYDRGRSKNAFKLKVHRDREALVINVVPNELLVQLPNGITFEAPCTLKTPPRIGDVVSFTYSGLDSATSIPLSPVVYRIRTDIPWPVVCESPSLNSTFKIAMPSEKVLKQKTASMNPAGHWTHNDNINMRKFLDSFARKRNFDSLIPHNWYNISRLEFVQEPGAASLLVHYNSSLIRCLQDLYPEVQFDESKFKKKSSHYWQSIPNRRKLFEDFAKNNNFDPLVPDNWYKYTREDLHKAKGGALLNYYQGSFVKAVIDLFPEIAFEEIRFKRTKSRYWQDRENRKRFLESFANKRGFNPANATRWYRTTQEDILKEKGGISFLNQYGMSLRKSLIDLFPTTDGWELHNFREKRLSSNPELAEYSTNKVKLRLYFDSLAHKLGFEPLDTDSWYSLSKKDLLTNQLGIFILQRYGTVASVVTDVYPELHFNPLNFGKRKRVKQS